MDYSSIANKIRSKDQKYISSLYKKSRSVFLSSIKRYASIDTEEALEYYQDAFLIMYDNVIDGKELDDNFGNYLIRIGKNLINSNYRKRKRLVSNYMMNNLQTASFIDEMEEELKESTKEEMVRLAIGALKEPCSKILTLLYWSKIKYEEMLNYMTNFKDVDSLRAQKYKCMKRLEVKLSGLFQKENLS